MTVLSFAVLSSGVAACGGSEGDDGARSSPTEAQTAEGPAIPSGSDLFAEDGCGSCHTFAAAGASGTVGPNLDETLERDARRAGKSLREFVRESIVAPDAFVAPGFEPSVMPDTFGDALDERELDALVSFLTQG